MAFRHSEIRAYCRCKQPAEHTCVRCGAPTCSNGLCYVPALSMCVECAQQRGLEETARRRAYLASLHDHSWIWGLILLVAAFAALWRLV